MRIKDKNIIGMAVAFALAALMLLWGYTAGADDKGINFTFEIDMNATDSGATTAQGNRTLRDFKDLYSSTSKIVTLVLKHTGSGVTKACVVGTALTLGSNIYLDIRPGAQFTLNANLTMASPGHILAACDQLLKGGGTGSLLFTADHLKCPAWDNSGSTTIRLPSAYIGALNVLGGPAVNEFSTDTTLAGDSDTALPTEKAVKAYVDGKVIAPTYYKHNLKIGPPGTSGVTDVSSTHCVAVTADELMLTDASGNKLLESGVSVTIDVALAGANGLDTGAEAVSTLYYVWVAHSGTTTQVAGFFSTSATSPTLPAMFTYKRLVGWVYNDASGNFLLMTRYDDHVKLWEPLTIYNNQTLQTWYLTITIPSPLALIEWTDMDLLVTQTTAGSHAVPVISGTTLPANPLIGVVGYSANQSNQFGIGYSPNLCTLPRIGSKTTLYIKTNHNSSTTGNNLQILGCTDPR